MHTRLGNYRPVGSSDRMVGRYQVGVWVSFYAHFWTPLHRAVAGACAGKDGRMIYVASQSSALTGVEHQAHTDPADIVRRVTGNNIVIIIRDKTVSFRSRSLTITGDHS